MSHDTYMARRVEECYETQQVIQRFEEEIVLAERDVIEAAITWRNARRHGDQSDRADATNDLTEMIDRLTIARDEAKAAGVRA